MKHEEGWKDLKVQKWIKGKNGTEKNPGMGKRLKKIPPRAWMSVSCECCVLSGRGLCDRTITCP
jgi:hypothetical protein